MPSHCDRTQATLGPESDANVTVVPYAQQSPYQQAIDRLVLTGVQQAVELRLHPAHGRFGVLLFDLTCQLAEDSG